MYDDDLSLCSKNCVDCHFFQIIDIFSKYLTFSIKNVDIRSDMWRGLVSYQHLTSAMESLGLERTMGTYRLNKGIYEPKLQN